MTAFSVSLLLILSEIASYLKVLLRTFSRIVGLTYITQIIYCRVLNQGYIVVLPWEPFKMHMSLATHSDICHQSFCRVVLREHLLFGEKTLQVIPCSFHLRINALKEEMKERV